MCTSELTAFPAVEDPYAAVGPYSTRPVVNSSVVHAMTIVVGSADTAVMERIAGGVVSGSTTGVAVELAEASVVEVGAEVEVLVLSETEVSAEGASCANTKVACPVIKTTAAMSDMRRYPMVFLMCIAMKLMRPARNDP